MNRPAEQPSNQRRHSTIDLFGDDYQTGQAVLFSVLRLHDKLGKLL